MKLFTVSSPEFVSGFDALVMASDRAVAKVGNNLEKVKQVFEAKHIILNQWEKTDDYNPLDMDVDFKNALWDWYRIAV